MDNKYTRVLEKSVVDMLQYSNLEIEDAIGITFETILKAEQSEYLGYIWGDKPKDDNKRNGYRSNLVRGLNRAFRIKVPRDRLGTFKPVFLELLSTEKEELDMLAFKLYCKGLTTRDIEDIFSEIYEQKYSRSSISRITGEFTEERELWQNRLLAENYYAVFIDALWLPVRRDTVRKEAFYIVLGLKDDLSRDVLSVWCLPEETASGWEELLKDLKCRGVKNVLNFSADGLSGLKESVERVFPNSTFQRCLVHKERNILNRVRASDKKEVALEFKSVFSIDDENVSLEEGKAKLNKFISKWSEKYPGIKNQFVLSDMDNYFSYLNYPSILRRMIYTTNWLESLNRKIKRTTKIRASFPTEESALNLVCAMLMDTCENNYNKYKITSLITVKDQLDQKLENLGNKNMF
jgi:putative transposase